MSKFARLLEENNPDAPRYIANNGKYILADTLQEAGFEVEVKDFYPLLYFTANDVRFRVVVEEAPQQGQKGEEEESLDQQEFLTPDEEKAVQMSRALATKPKGGFLGMNTPQGKMDKAYGNMMNKVSQKVTDIARKI